MFVELPASEAEFEVVGHALAGEACLFANMVPSGKTPVVWAEKLKRYGDSIVIYPPAGLKAACAALEQAYRYLEQRGSTADSPVPAHSMDELNKLGGFRRFGRLRSAGWRLSPDISRIWFWMHFWALCGSFRGSNGVAAVICWALS